MAMQTWADAIINSTMPQPFYIEAVDRVHGFLRFTAIPLLCDEIEEIEDKITGVSGKARTKVLVQALAKQIKGWHLDAQVTEENLRHLRRPLIIKAYEMIAIQRPSDKDPEVSYEDTEVSDDKSIEGAVGKS